MSDLKIIVFFLCFGVLFSGVVAMLGSEVGESGEYVYPEANETTPTLGAFDTLKSSLVLDTGVTVVDYWFVTIAGAIVAFLIYRAVRGQG